MTLGGRTGAPRPRSAAGRAGAPGPRRVRYQGPLAAEAETSATGTYLTPPAEPPGAPSGRGVQEDGPTAVLHRGAHHTALLDLIAAPHIPPYVRKAPSRGQLHVVVWHAEMGAWVPHLFPAFRQSAAPLSRMSAAGEEHGMPERE